MAGRTDKKDALTLAASWSDIDIVWMQGVSFEDMPTKAIPEVSPPARQFFSCFLTFPARLSPITIT